jgi:hypothetical protein
MSVLRMGVPALDCLLHGHDDWIVRAEDRLRLQCQNCGRETAGWDVPAATLRRPGPPSAARNRAMRNSGPAPASGGVGRRPLTRRAA